MSISFLSLSNYFGLIATGLLTFNFLLGIFVSTAYRKHRYWRKMPPFIQKLDLYNLHNSTAYIALTFVLLHPLMLLLDQSSAFSWIDFLYPVHFEYQQFFMFLGSLSLLAIVIVILSSQKKIKAAIGFKTWKNIHLISYITALLFTVHGTMMDPQLKNRAVDYIDGEKLISEACLLLLITAGILRYRYYKNQLKSKV